MLIKFQAWSKNATPLLDGSECAMENFKLPSDAVKESLFLIKTADSITKQALEITLGPCITVTERQLSDFLPTGKFGQEASLEQKEAMKHCKVSNIMSENESFIHRGSFLYYKLSIFGRKKLFKSNYCNLVITKSYENVFLEKTKHS